MVPIVHAVQSGPQGQFEKIHNRHDENVFRINEYSRVFDQASACYAEFTKLVIVDNVYYYYYYYYYYYVAVRIFGGAESFCATITFFFKWMNSVVKFCSNFLD